MVVRDGRERERGRDVNDNKVRKPGDSERVRLKYD
jgi:hypothetical protein